MKFKSALVTQASGSVGGFTAAHNSSGLYLRARSIPVNPNSAAQQLVRDKLAELSTAWIETLTSAQRDAWDTYAANVPVTNPLGDQIFVTGQNQYIRSNTPRLVAGATRVDDGPTTFDGATFTPVTATASESGADIEVAYDNGDTWANATGGHLIVQQSRQLNPTINFFKGPFRFADKEDGDDTTPPTSPLAVTSLFPLTENNVVYVRVRASNADGRLSATQIVRVVIGS